MLRDGKPSPKHRGMAWLATERQHYVSGRGAVVQDTYLTASRPRRLRPAPPLHTHSAHHNYAHPAHTLDYTRHPLPLAGATSSSAAGRRRRSTTQACAAGALGRRDTCPWPARHARPVCACSAAEHVRRRHELPTSASSSGRSSPRPARRPPYCRESALLLPAGSSTTRERASARSIGRGGVP